MKTYHKNPDGTFTIKETKLVEIAVNIPALKREIEDLEFQKIDVEMRFKERTQAIEGIQEKIDEKKAIIAEVEQEFPEIQGVTFEEAEIK